ncbi:hypothetical protein A3D84_05235 [Candidatus Woesebacteria bacterium RIFCSPHIGHO2_02_FULL_42_20]|uniref:Methyltransferase domain-containing protein n=1 Tax=Candidatus Woesebacteria bacterium RIFCSPHIGHO2_12_FULL_41_24 TaxID=1802510 RepID=A0A1F8AR92_9BACT|nr:MAG: hypothetical protein A2W15_04775 [Candidatus Woesebacteria bacterium RBG_16_41_13]OGM30612.1 MAG: hypothetical protein A2873_00670 [Candidatus Woesebacteria bacterium RIFCSPHIGHO2_01_FULL_42_80]OGM34594.1 MAG: hypothetical protein A3D84_05235 [Candidatus Woesebacteria bacterium RIFCSPHIGHO2_02_FULL_42_20]OGM53808.1 MAG: hypothetical protein A3E44_05320 [Candidatus Woesebacteria bacterium RIFCSPHIGHO2_12_FULL_41_24]OGM66000.1 MAG: hypothetical protein A2969_03415 [Candidatus Woesebacteri
MNKSSRINKFKWAGISPFFHHPIVFNFIPHDLFAKVVVDVGCGKGVYGFLIRATRDTSKAKMIGVDVSDEYLTIAKKNRVYDEYVVASLDKMPFVKSSVDLILAVEVISHLTKKNGEKFLGDLDKICRGRSIIVCPNMMKHSQPEFVKSDSHHSKWGADDFKRFGYRVYGFGARVYPPRALWQVKFYFALQYILTPISYFFPRIAGYLVAVKDFDE